MIKFINKLTVLVVEMSARQDQGDEGNMDIRTKIEAYADYLIEQRRYFHRHPELSDKEFNTAAHIREELDKIGIPWIKASGETGTLATIQGGKPGKTIMLRADIDALPVTEDTGLEYTSENPGVMHACGHDCHAAMLLTAAHVLWEAREEIVGTVKLFFEPAEEMATGAKQFIQEGHMEGIDAAFAEHVWSELDSGKISIEAGPRMAAGSRFEIFVHGKSSHGARPHLGRDAAVVSAAIVMNLQTLISRYLDPQETNIITIGEISAGNQYNVVPGEGYLQGTTRTFSYEIDEHWESMIRKVVEGTAAAYDAEAELVYHYLIGPVINDEAFSCFAEQSLRKIGGEGIVGKMKATTTSEDTSEYLKLVPGALAFVGIRNDACDSAWPQHSNHYKVDESALLAGAALYAQVAMDYGICGL